MPTIKTKKEMDLGELIEWGIKNGITSKEYTCNNKDGYKSVIFDIGGKVCLNRFQTYLANDKYEVEIEEPITEDTKLVLVSRCIGKLGSVSYMYDRTTINGRLKNLPKDCKITHIYIENEDKDLVLIWKNGKMEK